MLTKPDIVVIGAGIIGASAAWRLAQAGRRVTLLDAGGLGGEASWAGAGMLAPGGEIERRSAWSDFALGSLGLYRGFVAELREESGLAIDYQEHGAVEIARTSEEWDELRARAAAQREFGIASEPMDAGQLRKLAPLAEGDHAGALYFPRDALVDPRDVTRALRQACARREVRIREHCRVTAIRASAGQVAVETEAGALAAPRAVLAAGAWSSRIPIEVDGVPCPIPRSFPVRGTLLGFRLEPGSLGPILRHRHTYIVQRASGFTVAGGSMEEVDFDRSLDPRILADIHERAASLLPCLRRAPEPEAWVGFRPATEDFQPRIGPLAGTGLWLCYGHFRNGILLAPATAARVCREITASWETGWSAPGGSL